MVVATFRGFVNRRWKKTIKGCKAKVCKKKINISKEVLKLYTPKEREYK